MAVLNKIILCIQLGIPLKEMVKYIDENVYAFPAGDYECVQVDMNPTQDLIHAIRRNWENKEKITVIVDNVTLDKFSFETRRSELQKKV